MRRQILLLAIFCALGSIAVAQSLGGMETEADGREEPAEWQALRREYNMALRALQVERDRSIRSILQRSIQRAGAELEERQRTRNVRLIMIARSMKEALEHALRAFEQEGRVQWPDSVRREVEEELAAVKNAVDQVVAAAENRAEELRERALNRFATIVPPEQRPEFRDELAALFERWLRREWPPREVAGGENPLDTPAEPEKPPAPPPVDFFAVSPGGPGEGAEWETVARWTGTLMGPSVIRLAVPGERGIEEGRVFNPLTQRESAWRWERLTDISPGTTAHWRAKRVPDRERVDVLEWPSRENREQLVIRSPQATRFPLEVGFELQRAVLDRPVSTSAGGQGTALADTRSLVEVRVTSEPPGATIWVNGRPYREEGRLLRTPATIRVPPENLEIRLRMDGYADHVVSGFRARDLRQLHGRLVRERDLPGKRVRVNPRQVWQVVEGVTVRPGDRLVVAASGEWRIGEQGEPCGPDGYDPRDPRYRHYYEGPGAAKRQLADAPYGALLVRIGFPGPVFLAGSESSIPVRVGGVVMLDVNEGFDEALRKDNRGSMDVKVIVIPGESR